MPYIIALSFTPVASAGIAAAETETRTIALPFFPDRHPSFPYKGKGAASRPPLVGLNPNKTLDKTEQMWYNRKQMNVREKDVNLPEFRGAREGHYDTLSSVPCSKLQESQNTANGVWQKRGIWANKKRGKANKIQIKG